MKHVNEFSAREMSPETRVDLWEVSTPVRDEPDSADNVELPPSPPTSLERPYTDFEGDTVIDAIAQDLNQDPEGDWDANEETFVVDEDKYIEQHRQEDALIERQRRENQGRELRAAGWPEDAVFLFQKLGMRGFEPLLPHIWFDDFNTLPADLFTRNVDKAFIKPISTRPDAEYHGRHTFDSIYFCVTDIALAFKALEELFGLGGRVRDAVLQKAPIRTAENHIRSAVLKYNKWALKDGNIENLWGDISLFDVISCYKKVNSKVAEAKMIRKLEKRANQWREALHLRKLQDESLKGKGRASDMEPLPEVNTLYGIVAVHTIMAFVAYDVNATRPLLRTVAMFDLGQEGYDVWNSLAIAIFVIHCRNRLIQLQDALPEPDPLPTDGDPDV
jgi:hypothetical protein